MDWTPHLSHCRQHRCVISRSLRCSFPVEVTFCSTEPTYRACGRGRVPAKKGARATCLRTGCAHASAPRESVRVDIRLPLLNVIILTYQEELNLPHALHSLKGLDCEIFVVDSGSTDRTVEIA